MKKTLVTMLAAIAVAASSYGQGTINFVNGSTSLVTINSTSASSAAGAKVEFLWAPAGTTDVNLFTVFGNLVNVGTPTPGRFSGGIQTVPGIPAGGAAAIIVRGFVGTDYATAGTRGSTAILNFASTGNPLTTPAGTAAALTTDGGFTGLNLTAVPEPTSMALAGLGAASLLIFRRRK